MQNSSQGLRERKRNATRRALEAAAVNLCAERGLQGVTIEEISAVADVSARTFFNYYSSKEDAILGNDFPQLFEIAEEIRFTGSTSHELLTDIENYIAGLCSEIEPNLDLIGKKFQLLQTHPEIALFAMGRMAEFEARLADLIAPLLKETTVEQSSRDRAHMVVLLAGSAMRHALSKWMASGWSGDLSALTREGFALLYAVAGSDA